MRKRLYFSILKKWYNIISTPQKNSYPSGQVTFSKKNLRFLSISSFEHLEADLHNPSKDPFSVEISEVCWQDPLPKKLYGPEAIFFEEKISRVPGGNGKPTTPPNQPNMGVFLGMVVSNFDFFTPKITNGEGLCRGRMVSFQVWSF